MKPEDITLWNWNRVLLGEVPPAFLLEIVFRMVCVYVILMLSMRLLGKRMSSQFSRNELAAMVSLAAAIGVPILSPDRGILPAVVIAIIVVSISRLIALLAARNEKIESLTQGTIDTLVKDAVMDVRSMTKTRITKERIMAQLRSENVCQLGEVKRLYLEANGSFTLIRAAQHKPGLAVIPEADHEFYSELKTTDIHICHECGFERTRRDMEVCPNCKNNKWVSGVEFDKDRADNMAVR